jgi:hypothetical protein
VQQATSDKVVEPDMRRPTTNAGNLRQLLGGRAAKVVGQARRGAVGHRARFGGDWRRERLCDVETGKLSYPAAVFLSSVSSIGDTSPLPAVEDDEVFTGAVSAGFAAGRTGGDDAPATGADVVEFGDVERHFFVKGKSPQHFPPFLPRYI